MYGGNSGCYGMVIYDTKTDRAVYGYYEEEAIVLKTGSRQEMMDVKNSHESAVEKENRKEHRIMGLLLLTMVLVCVLAAVFGTGRSLIAALVFCLISYFPLLIIAFANIGMYKDLKCREAFRRFHGCEHTLIHNLSKGREITQERLRKTSIYDSECGTAYSGYVAVIAAELAILILLWPGLLKSALILVATVVLLLINIFNPMNPFLLLQKPVVSRPADREYQLAIAIAEKLKEL